MDEKSLALIGKAAAGGLPGNNPSRPLLRIANLPHYPRCWSGQNGEPLRAAGAGSARARGGGQPLLPRHRDNQGRKEGVLAAPEQHVSRAVAHGGRHIQSSVAIEIGHGQGVGSQAGTDGGSDDDGGDGGASILTLFLETAILVDDARQFSSDSEVPLARKLTRDAARQMAAARKSFRGGRPLKPKPCPRCGTPCASAVEAAAHCVGPEWRKRAKVARLVAKQQRRAAEDRGQEYPKMIYHPTKPAVVVNSAQEEAEIREEWGDDSVLKP